MRLYRREPAERHIYIGVTSDLARRMCEHAQGLISGFSKRHGTKVLVYYEMFETMDEAIGRQKRLKDWKRLWNIRPIETMNPEWSNLFDEVSGAIGFGSADRGAPDDRWAHVVACHHPGLRRDDIHFEGVPPKFVIPAEAGIQAR